MSVYVVDAYAAMAIARHGGALRPGVEVWAPTLVRSQILSVARGEVVQHAADVAETLALAEHACRLPRRLLGDAVLRKVAWTIASEHGWPDTYDAEYLALTQLHGEALVTGEPGLRARAEGIVPVVTVDTVTP